MEKVKQWLRGLREKMVELMALVAIFLLIGGVLGLVNTVLGWDYVLVVGKAYPMEFSLPETYFKSVLFLGGGGILGGLVFYLKAKWKLGLD